jgi:hypothetical protein
MRASIRRLALVLVLASGLAGLAMTACDFQHGGAPVEATPPTPQAAAPATPGPPTQVYGCGLPRGTGLGRGCGRESPEFMDAINAAIDKTIDENPDLFRDLLATGGEYMDEVVENLRRAGFCALNDGEEIAIKNSNDFSEQYDILSSGGNVLRAYMATCRPAWDAIPPAGDRS